MDAYVAWLSREKRPVGSLRSSDPNESLADGEQMSIAEFFAETDNQARAKMKRSKEEMEIRTDCECTIVKIWKILYEVPLETEE